MAIIVYKFNDANAPSLSGDSLECIVALLKIALVTGYTGKNPQIWTLIHDSLRETTGLDVDGTLILEHPDGDYVLVLKNKGSVEMEIGLAVEGYPDGSATGYITGSNLGGLTAAKRMTWQSTFGTMFSTNWAVIYDDQSHSFWIIGANTSADNYTEHPSGNAHEYSPAIFVGTLAEPNGGTTQYPIVLGGTNSTSRCYSPFTNASYAQQTTLKQTNGGLAADETNLLVNGFVGRLATAEKANYTGFTGPDEPYFPLKPLGARIADSGKPAMEVGLIRGALQHAWLDGQQSSARDFVAHYWPTQYAQGNRFVSPLPIDGYDYYLITGVSTEQIFISTNPNDWV